MLESALSGPSRAPSLATHAPTHAAPVLQCHWMRRLALVLALAAAALVAARADAERPKQGVGYLTTAVATFSTEASIAPAVAAFPDVTAERPAPLADPALALLSDNPYERELAAARARQALFTTEMANPYTEQLTIANPYAEAQIPANPYTRRVLAVGNAEGVDQTSEPPAAEPPR